MHDDLLKCIHRLLHHMLNKVYAQNQRLGGCQSLWKQREMAELEAKVRKNCAEYYCLLSQYRSEQVNDSLAEDPKSAFDLGDADLDTLDAGGDMTLSVDRSDDYEIDVNYDELDDHLKEDLEFHPQAQPSFASSPLPHCSSSSSLWTH